MFLACREEFAAVPGEWQNTGASSGKLPGSKAVTITFTLCKRILDASCQRLIVAIERSVHVDFDRLLAHIHMLLL